MKVPERGELIRITEVTPYGEDRGEHICTVVDVLSAQLRATYEVARQDGGWDERSLFTSHRNVEWDVARQCWTGKAG